VEAVSRAAYSSGAIRILNERQRQMEKEGWTAEHDDEHTNSELAYAAVAYAAPHIVYAKREYGNETRFVDVWPEDWDNDWDKRPRGKYTNKKRIRALEKAGALIAAEIDRLLRLEEP
jgi:hypothetical protein